MDEDRATLNDRRARAAVVGAFLLLFAIPTVIHFAGGLQRIRHFWLFDNPFYRPECDPDSTRYREEAARSERGGFGASCKSSSSS